LLSFWVLGKSGLTAGQGVLFNAKRAGGEKPPARVARVQPYTDPETALNSHLE